MARGSASATIDFALPAGRVDRRADHHPVAAVGAIGLEHQHVVMLADELDQIARVAVGQRGLAIGEHSGPEHVAAKNLPLFGREIFVRELLIGEQLPAAFVVELAGQRRNRCGSAGTAGAPASRFTPSSLSSSDQVADFVIAIGDVDSACRRNRLRPSSTYSSAGSACTIVRPCRCAIVLGQHFLLVGPLVGCISAR